MNLIRKTLATSAALAGIVALNISIAYAQLTEYIIFEVKDQGCGIPESLLPKLFEAFEKSEIQPDVGLPGAGLGLAIAKRILELHGSGIDVESTVGEGTIFRIILPT